jgi:Na+-translocating ferredoxin:NAD+ oxidoreductase RnfC subunit
MEPLTTCCGRIMLYNRAPIIKGVEFLKWKRRFEETNIYNKTYEFYY